MRDYMLRVTGWALVTIALWRVVPGRLSVALIFKGSELYREAEYR